jgi:hypothetical protein
VSAFAVVGTTPIGGPLIGWVAEEFGPRWAYAMGGIVTIVSAIVFSILYARHRHQRPVDFGAAETELVLGVDGEAIPATIGVRA